MERIHSGMKRGLPLVRKTKILHLLMSIEIKISKMNKQIKIYGANCVTVKIVSTTLQKNLPFCILMTCIDVCVVINFTLSNKANKYLQPLFINIHTQIITFQIEKR